MPVIVIRHGESGRIPGEALADGGRIPVIYPILLAVKHVGVGTLLQSAIDKYTAS
jgi:hypothetical protein